MNERCGVSLSGRIIEAICVLEALEEDFRSACEDVKSSRPGDDGAWSHLESAADHTLSAANTIRTAKSQFRGAILRGAEIP